MKSIETDAVKRNKGFFILLLFFFALFLSASDGYSFTITANAGAGGYISPSGDVPVAAGADQTFTIMPDLGYEIFDVATDSGSVGLVSSYTFIDVAADDSITASFSACTNTETVKLQSNGFFYNTIIGAYFAANPGSDTIMLKAGTLPDEILFFDQDVSVVIDGGNNCDFTDNYMMTRIPGSLTVAAGTVTLSNIILSEPLFCQEGDPNYPPQSGDLRLY